MSTDESTANEVTQRQFFIYGFIFTAHVTKAGASPPPASSFPILLLSTLLNPQEGLPSPAPLSDAWDFLQHFVAVLL